MFFRDGTSGEKAVSRRYTLDLKSDLRGCVERIAAHIGCGDVPAEILDDVAERASFASMRRDVRRFQPKSVTWVDPSYSFIRKGEVGDHVALFSERQLARFEGAVEATFGGPGASPPFQP